MACAFGPVDVMVATRSAISYGLRRERSAAELILVKGLVMAPILVAIHGARRVYRPLPCERIITHASPRMSNGNDDWKLAQDKGRVREVREKGCRSEPWAHGKELAPRAHEIGRGKS